ncbi:MAG: 16S rRNA (guanine(966)-N(2))-methyltransferase RsmD [Gammaproteobacteria bacterium]|nr:16S rRNA (guanine(966)-N(2))-methyltransferase RsmD [Gammaproteobacteria bacterium]
MKKPKRGQCRIIAGKWRGRKISFNDAEGLRPTTDRIRETVFNWLQPYIQKSHCLDAFAGSGVLGFEALSRGAENVVFIEKTIETVKRLKENVTQLDVKSASIYHADTLNWLRSQSIHERFDLVFLDPPFHSDLLSKTSVLLNSSGCLTEDAIIYVEHAVDTDIVLPESWLCKKEKCAGQVVYKIFERQL